MIDTSKFGQITFSEWFNTLDTTFVSFYFIVFVFLLALLYYIFPKKSRWIILLAGSVCFYLIAGWEALVAILLSSLVVWEAGIIIANTDKAKKKKRRLLLFVFVICLLSVLVFVKCYSLFKWNFNLVIPLGISYYTFSSIGYIADVYWGKEKPEFNYFKMALFLLFFPKILQGPISRHKDLAPQLAEGHSFNYKNFCFGIQLAIWGYFKKMVIADRIAIITSAGFNDYKLYGGSTMIIVILLSALQMYTDFSGCMDIAGGVSQMFGIELEKNFDHPFFAKSAAEFWQRWHMTLSGWFRDYLFLPISRSELVKKISKAMGNKFGPTARKNTAILISSLVVWLATGLWHGSGLPYLAWGLYWYLVISISLLLAKPFEFFKTKLKIDENAFAWRLFQMIRTYCIFSVGRLITVPGDLQITGSIIRNIFVRFNAWELFDNTLFSLGLNWRKFGVLLVAILILIIIENLQLKGSIRESISKRNFILRAIIYSLSIIVILVFGVYGSGAGNTTFLYVNY